jgi:biopolymer transport protein ExbD
MKDSRRIKRMSRSKRKIASLGLTSMMDVFTILVFFLLVNSGDTELLKAPKDVKLPESIVEAKPRETVVIFVDKEEVLVQGEPTVSIADIAADNGRSIAPIAARLADLRERVIGVQTQAVARSQEVTILADKSIPFEVIRRVMATCTAQGYTHISLAVIQKEAAPVPATQA